MVKSVTDLFSIIENYTESIVVRELGGLKAPIDIKTIVKNYGIKVITEDMDKDKSGVIVIEENKSGIIINKSDSWCRQRFTLAHEFGHFISYKLQNKTGSIIEFRDGRSSLGFNEEEIFANKFAAAILMPRSLLIGLLNMVDGDNYINSIAKVFDVSEKALEIRIKNLLSTL